MNTSAINSNLESGEAFIARGATGPVAPDNITASLGAAASGVTMALNFQWHRAQRCSQGHPLDRCVDSGCMSWP